MTFIIIYVQPSEQVLFEPRHTVSIRKQGMMYLNLFMLSRYKRCFYYVGNK